MKKYRHALLSFAEMYTILFARNFDFYSVYFVIND